MAEIAVVGGSLGGLNAACLLRDAGHDVSIYERSPSPLEERGAGIGFLEATSRYLVERIGLGLDEISIETDHIRYLHRDGAVAHERPHPYRFSSWNTVYRHLLAHWIGSGEERDRYRLGHEMVRFSQDAGGVEVGFGNGRSVRCDALVCADGVGSVGRSRLQPESVQSYAGYVAWRGMVPEATLAPETARFFTDAITYYVYANSHLLAYPIPAIDGSLDPGDRLINIVWYRNYAPGDDLDDLLTDRNGESRSLSLPPGMVTDHHIEEAKATATARLPPPLAELVCAVDDLFVQVIYDVEVERVAFGRVCLIGDAAFVVRPHAAAGTAKACDDGWQLAAAFSGDCDVVTALQRWETDQLALGRDLLARTRSVGRRSQVDGNWEVGDPDLIFGLYRPGE